MLGYFGHVAASPSRAEVTAEQFCALGSGSGASLFDIAGWMKAAERTNEDWDQVIREIDERCPRWRRQVVDRADDLDS